MPGSLTAEIIFIAAMMILILIVSFGSVYFFFRQYKKEMRQKAERIEQKAALTANGHQDNDATS